MSVDGENPVSGYPVRYLTSDTRYPIMPKERFHIYLAGEVLESCADLFPPADRMAFFTGALSPDIFFYDVPSFSLSPFGDALHAFMDREGISAIADWIQNGPRGNHGGDSSRTRVAWALGFACHFLTDAVWHPVIDELSGSLGCCAAWRLSPIECHRLIESELEALRLAGPGAKKKCNLILKRMRGRAGLLDVASHYGAFLEFAGLVPVPERKKIVKCYLKQNRFLALFSNPLLGVLRNLLLEFPGARFLGSLVTPARPVLPYSFSHTLPPDRNPLSDYFMEHALTLLKEQLPALAQRLR